MLYMKTFLFLIISEKEHYLFHVSLSVDSVLHIILDLHVTCQVFITIHSLNILLGYELILMQFD